MRPEIGAVICSEEHRLASVLSTIARGRELARDE
jgi:hypothetical protein